jgi:hypothetical protein
MLGRLASALTGEMEDKCADDVEFYSPSAGLTSMRRMRRSAECA